MRKVTQGKKYIDYMYRYTIKWDVLFSLVTASLLIIPLIGKGMGFIDIFFEYQKGFSKCSISIIEFIKYSAFYIYAMYLNCIQYENEKRGYNISIKYRCNNEKYWDNLVQYGHRKSVLKYWLIYYFTHIIVALLVSGSQICNLKNINVFLDYYNLSMKEFNWIIVLSALLSLVELYVVMNIFELWNILVDSVAVSFVLMTITMVIPSLFHVNYYKIINCIGNSSAYNLLEYSKLFGINQTIISVVSIYIIDLLVLKLIARLLKGRKKL